MDYVPDTPYGTEALNFGHVAKMANLSEDYIRCEYNGCLNLPFMRLAGRVIFLRGEVQQWLAKRAAEGRKHALATDNTIRAHEEYQRAMNEFRSQGK